MSFLNTLTYTNQDFYINRDKILITEAFIRRHTKSDVKVTDDIIDPAIGKLLYCCKTDKDSGDDFFKHFAKIVDLLMEISSSVENDVLFELWSVIKPDNKNPSLFLGDLILLRNTLKELSDVPIFKITKEWIESFERKVERLTRCWNNFKTDMKDIILVLQNYKIFPNKKIEKIKS